MSKDLPNTAIIAVVQALHRDGHRIIVLSGRTEAARAATLAWLERHLQVPVDALYPRARGDRRKDVVVKHEIYLRRIKNHYQILCVSEDRNQVVGLWRSLDLTCLQVAPATSDSPLPPSTREPPAPQGARTPPPAPIRIEQTRDLVQKLVGSVSSSGSLMRGRAARGLGRSVTSGGFCGRHR